MFLAPSDGNRVIGTGNWFWEADGTGANNNQVIGDNNDLYGDGNVVGWYVIDGPTPASYWDGSHSDNNHIKGDSNFVHGNGNDLYNDWDVGAKFAFQNNIRGNDNTINGDQNNVGGDDNSIQGESNDIFGDRNVLFDTTGGWTVNNTVVGDNNDIVGDVNAVTGNNNVLFDTTGGRAQFNAVTGSDNSVNGDLNVVTGDDNTVSVGAPGAERRVTNVAPGVNGTDAVNKNQLNAVQSYAARNRAMINQTRTMIEEDRASIRDLDSRVHDYRDKAYSGVAAAATLASLATPSAPGKTVVNAGVGFYESESALGVNATHQLGIGKLAEKRAFVNAGVAVTSEDTVLGRVVAAFEF